MTKHIFKENDMVEINRGAEWGKWDLHVHSPFTVLNNQYKHNNHGEISDSEIRGFIEKLKSQKIKVVGLTNYFNFKDQDFELKKTIESEGITVFMNLEIRLSNVNKSDQFLDYHIIFDDELEERYIKNFLGNLKAHVGDEDKSVNVLTKSEIEKNANVDFSELMTKLNEEGNGLKGRYLTALLSRGHGSATSESDAKTQTLYANLARHTDFVLHGPGKEKNQQEDKIFWTEKSPYIRAVFQSSDAHELEQIGSNVSWVKSSTTFEGLRQTLLEPISRIVYLLEHTDLKNDYQVIDYIQRENGNKIYLNSNLNVLIGGRSTGKSTLTNSIAKTLNVTNPIAEVEDLHGFDENIKIVWRTGSENENGEIEFLSQNYMIDIADDDKVGQSNTRNKLIESVVKNNHDEFNKIQKFKEDIAKNKQIISALFNDYVETNNQLNMLRAPDGDEESINSQIIKFQEQIEDLRKNSESSVEEAKMFDEFKTRIGTLNSEIARLGNDYQQLNNLSPLKLEQDSINGILNSELQIKLNGILESITTQMNVTWQEQVSNVLKTVTENAKDMKNELVQLEHDKTYLKGLEELKNNEALNILVQKQAQERAKLEKITTYHSNVKDLMETIEEIEQAILVNYDKYNALREDLAADFNLQAGPVEIKLNFIPVIFKGNMLYKGANKNNDFIDDFNKDSRNVIKDIFAKKDLSFNGNYEYQDLISELLNNVWFDYEYNLIYENDNFNTMSQGKKSFVILSLILEFSDEKKPVIIDQPEDSLDNRAIFTHLTKYLKEKKEQRQIIVITHNPNVVVGSDAENIIIANQHSEASPNINEEQFDYLNGSLDSIEALDENSEYILPKLSIRQHMFDILEGGQDAFEKRERKYKIK